MAGTSGVVAGAVTAVAGSVGVAAGTEAGFKDMAADIKQLAHDFKLLRSQLSWCIHLTKASIWPTPSKASSGRDEHFREKLMKFYGNHPHTESKLMKCMITGWQVPSDAIRAGHLIPVRLAAVASALGLGNINNPCNGLLWCDFIEVAFECWDICFSFGPLPNTLKLHVVNKKLASKKLVGLTQCEDKGYVRFQRDRLVRSLDNCIVTITAASGTGSDAFPMRRAIAWHAASAIDMARTKGLLPNGFKEEALDLKVTSEFDEVEAVEAWASMCHKAGPPEEVSTIAEDEDEGLPEEELQP